MTLKYTLVYDSEHENYKKIIPLDIWPDLAFRLFSQ